MTPSASASRLTLAGWEPANTEDNWTHPDTGHRHSWPVALMLADLPRIRHLAEVSGVSQRLSIEKRVSKSQIVADLKASGMDSVKIAKRLGIARKTVGKYSKRTQSESQPAQPAAGL